MNHKFRNNAKRTVSIVFTLAGLFFGVSLLTNFAGNDDVQKAQSAEIERLRDEVYRLKKENAVLNRYRTDMEELDSKIADLRSAGYRPDRLLVRHLQKKSRQFNIDNEFIHNVLKTESSFWSNLEGPFGEVGGFQILPQTLKYYVELFGVDAADINIADYQDIRTNTEWAYVMFLDMKLKRKKLEWTYWNTGFQEDKRN